MRAKSVLILSALFLTAIFATSQVLADMPDIIVIDNVQAKKAAVPFPHNQHSEAFECVTCHHTSQEKEDIPGCFTCHGVDPAIPDPTVSSKKENPFHIRCAGCHKEMAAGPTKCSGCHTS